MDSNDLQTSFIAGVGEMPGRIKQHDWGGTTLGPVGAWPQALKTLVTIMLGSIQPMFVAWGSKRTLLYNEAYAAVLANKHPALGEDFLDVWHEIKADLEPLVTNAYRGEPSRMDNIELVMQRKGYPERTHWTYSYTPVRDERGTVVGVFCACHEITSQVLAEQTQNLRVALEEQIRSVSEPRAVMAAAVELLGRHLGANRVGYGEVQSDDNAVLLHSCFVDGVEPLTGLYRLDAFGTDDIARQHEGRTQWRDDLTLDPRQDQAVWSAIETRAYVSTPLVRDGRFTASLYVNFREPHVWTASEIELIEEVAARTWSAVERARAETRLRESERRLRALLAAGSYSIYRMSPDWQEMRQLDGRAFLTDTEVSSAHWLEVYTDPADRPGILAAINSAICGKTTFELEHRVRRADGSFGWTLSRAVPIVDDDGQVIEWFGAASDVTDRKRAEDRLAALNRSLEARVATAIAERDAAWNNARDLLVVTDKRGYVLAANPAWTRVIGWREDELVGRPLSDFVLPDDEALTLEVFTTATADSLPALENRYRHKDGSHRWISWVAAPQGEQIYANGRDVTAEKAREVELKAIQDVLLQAQKMDAVGQLTGGIAHDFNNLLQGVAGCLDLIRRKPEDAAGVRNLAEAGLQAAERGAKLTGQLLAFSRAQRIEAKPLLVPDLLKSMRNLLERTLGPAIRITFDLDERPEAVLADATQLEMAVLNLAINARDAMPDGGDITVAARLRHVARDPELEAGDYVDLSVADTGSGMPPDVVSRAFDPFFTTKEVGKGTGLGLSQVYGIARAAGGIARIESRPGRGTTVRLLLRRTDQSVPVREDTRDLGAKPERSAFVLVIDDDADVRRFLHASLDALGFAVEMAADGREGLEALDRIEPDVLILDYAMPGTNGAEVFRSARERKPDLPIIFATGYANTAALERAAGRSTPVLRKPFRIDELQVALSDALKSRPGRQTL